MKSSLKIKSVGMVAAFVLVSAMPAYARVVSSGVTPVTSDFTAFGPGAGNPRDTTANAYIDGTYSDVEGVLTEKSGTVDTESTENSEITSQNNGTLLMNSNTTYGPMAGAEAQAADENELKNYYAQMDVSQLTDQQFYALSEYFKGSVIIGDSVAENFQRYNITTNKGDIVSDSFTSLAVAGYSLSKALLPNDGENIHPMVQGARHRLPEAIGLVGAKHVYSFFGYKDLNDPEAADNYEKLLKEITEVNPGVDIAVISTTYMTEKSQNDDYNNDKVRSLNTAMKEKCRVNGWEFIDVQDIMSDGNGNLPEEWSIDKKMHYNYQYYIYWVNEMKRTALRKLGL